MASLAGVRERLICLCDRVQFSRDRGVFQKSDMKSPWGHMFTRLLDTVFGCWHLHYGFPITPRHRFQRTKAALLTGTYVVCLDCGTELPYDWNTMKIVSSTGERAKLAASLAPKEAA